MKIANKSPKVAKRIERFAPKRTEGSGKNTNIKGTVETLSTKEDYNKAMMHINTLMAKGSDVVSKEELAEIRRLALLAQAYEKNAYTIPMPTTLPGIIEMKMYEMHLNQSEMARKLHVSNAKLSLIMNGKQKPDINFLKTVRTALEVDANLLMEAV